MSALRRPAAKLIRMEQSAGTICHPSEDVFEAYLLRQLPEAQARWVEGHTAQCGRCKVQMEQTKLFLAVIQNALRRISPRKVDLLLGETCPPPLFRPEDLRNARASLPVSQAIISRCLNALSKETVSLDSVAALAMQDPGIALHLIGVANSALFSSGRDVRSIERAIFHLGFHRTKLHILGLLMKASFATSQLRRIWDHSIEVARIARTLAETTGAVHPDEACLAGLVHDIGNLVLVGLGANYETSCLELKKRGIPHVEIERQLCGSDHAQIGADLLESWWFPADLVASVRYHHEPCLSDSRVASILYLAENVTGEEDGSVDPVEHALALKFLGIKESDLQLAQNSHHADLSLLQFAA